MKYELFIIGILSCLLPLQQDGVLDPFDVGAFLIFAYWFLRIAAQMDNDYARNR